ncbi:MAG: mechanosensitive ion channel [Ignavibacteriaceae bacterium]|nr:mechanosensitive ion channel [Ignavibacteriaceae bacterium]
MNKINEIFNSIVDFLSVPVFSLGSSNITLWTLVYLTILFLLLYFVTTKLFKYVVYKFLSKSKIDLGVRIAIGSILKYLILTIGFIVIIQTVGINLSSLTILLGALGVGIGFGLQNVTNNFVSGIIILFERPIKVGDRIDVAGVAGNVIKISMRATTIITNDNISIIVPNSEFISSTVINWSHADRNVRFNFPVGVAYKEDPEKIKNLLLKVAGENEGVLKNPGPDVLFDNYGDSSLNFNLRVWTSRYIDRPGVLKSQLYYEIFKGFKSPVLKFLFRREMFI